MKRLAMLLGAAAILSGSVATNVQCPGGTTPPASTTLTITTVNDTSEPMEVTYRTSSDGSITEANLLATGDATVFSLDAGGTHSFDVDCDQAQALILDRAEIPSGVWVGTYIGYLGTDYECGDVLTFDITGNVDLSMLYVDISYSTQ